jgi:hypothetical protein
MEEQRANTSAGLVTNIFSCTGSRVLHGLQTDVSPIEVNGPTNTAAVPIKKVEKPLMPKASFVLLGDLAYYRILPIGDHQYRKVLNWPISRKA